MRAGLLRSGYQWRAARPGCRRFAAGMGGAAERSRAEREQRHKPTGAADAAAVRAVQAGDAARFGELYLRYYDRVHAYSRLILRDGDEAQDNAQETFMRALQALGRYRLPERFAPELAERKPPASRGGDRGIT